ncbi:M20/M25/M40 family metallo-hydrolase [Dysgonomonas sp. 511]|uniref:M20/M25/M40 family metallo-hydrolase n=1 Tax=Dysgonomonas sp. 511 TaxID=2302930 RepID=UPI0013D18D1A|nr:M20/M25/M40 family metallo-hydrolase [Dysgonomonas sp. 511]NDV79019.1 M20/M25/M40 family metallo-hydrolase [Dysgonomonas sp. 511]
MLHRIIVLFLLIIPVCSFSQTPLEKGLSSITKQKAELYIGYLASDSLEGRESGKQGAKLASEYIKDRLQEMGVKPWKGKYFQNFDPMHGADAWAKSRREPYAGREMRNVVGCIPGKNTDEVVIIGAHYDHIGITSPNNLNDSINNGADDNASGVSAVLQIAEAFIASGQKPERTVVFGFWDAEEIGLVGSYHFVNDHFDNVPIPRMFPQVIKAYINCDMIGRDKDATAFNHVIAYYTEGAPVLKEWITEDIAVHHLNLAPEFKTEQGFGGSDHMPFSEKDVPYIFYFTDLHPDYHRPGDQADKINYNKVTEITKVAFLNLWRMANLKKLYI